MSAPHLLRLGGEGQGELVRIADAVILLGRNKQPALPINHRAVSRRHARIFTRHGGWFLEDLGSKNGTILNHALIGPPVELRNDDVINLGNGARFRYIDDPMADEIYRGRMVMIRARDPIAGTMPQAEFKRQALCEVAFHTKYDLPLAYVVTDIDGSAVSREALPLAKEMARRIRSAARKHDLICHLGLYRFAVLHRQTSRQDGLKLAERIRAEVNAQPLRLGSANCSVTLSAGVAAIPGQDSTLDGLQASAELALEQARRSGGNRSHSAK